MKDSDIESARNVPLVEIIERLNIPHQMVGGNYSILCTFHDEFKGSMVVYDYHFHCFGCGEHGDGITLVRKLLGLPFKETVELINLIGKGK